MPRIGRTVYWILTGFAVIFTIYAETVLGSEAIAKGDWSGVLSIAALGFLIWSVGLGLSHLLRS